MTKKIFGFTLIEVIVALSMAAVLGSISIAVYKKHIVQVNQDSTKQNMVTLMSYFEQQYNIYGSYTTNNGDVPSAIILALSEPNRYYRFAVYSKDATEYGLSKNTQSLCLIAFPLSNSIMSGSGSIIVDNFGNSKISTTDDFANKTLCGTEAKLLNK